MDWKNIVEKAKNMTIVGAGKAILVGEMAKLGLENVSEEENIHKSYADIGKRYVSLHAGTPEEGYEGFFRKIDEAKRKVEKNKIKIANLKADIKHDP